jgi:hypothetical protein
VLERFLVLFRLGPVTIRPPKLAHEPHTRPDDISDLDPTAIKIVGQLRKTAWVRFACRQRTVARLTKGHGQPAGGSRVSSREACVASPANLDRERT